ncbi:MAG: DUF4350 domain-containing protein [Cyanobacteria bacterium P01_F01_bin.150]
MKFPRRGLWIGLGLIGLLLVLALTLLPTNRPITQGSTFSRAPDGYGAWYAYMQDQGFPIERWQRVPDVLWDSEDDPPTTIVQVFPSNARTIGYGWNQWIERGNTLIALRSQQPVTRAPFSSQLTSPLTSENFVGIGPVQIHTRRRQNNVLSQDTVWLGDDYGVVVWQQARGDGFLVEATTPNIGANAYQDSPGNFAFLAALVQETSAPDTKILVDEYLHGYEDIQEQGEEEETQTSWVNYLAQTPLVLVIVQAIALCLALLWGYQRIGPPIVIPQPAQNNSEAYISALAGVLREAKSTQFVVEMVTKAEQLRVQKALGLGQGPVDDQTLVKTWAQQTKRSPTELQSMLELGKRNRLTEKDLVKWLQDIRALHSETH